MLDVVEFDDFGDLERLGEQPRKQQSRKSIVDKWLAVSSSEKIPPVDGLIPYHKALKLGDIGVFSDKPSNLLLKQLYGIWWQKTKINEGTAKIKDIERLGHQLFACDAFPPVLVAKLEDDGYCCLFGREYVLVLAILYGVNLEIPVLVYDVNLEKAIEIREALGCSTVEIGDKEKSPSPTKKAFKKATEEDASCASDGAICACLDGKTEVELTFPVGIGKGRRKDTLTSLTAVKKFWENAVDEADRHSSSETEKAIGFLNLIVRFLLKEEKFQHKEHLGIKSLISLGKFYRRASKNGLDSNAVEALAKRLVQLDDIGKRKSSEILSELTKKE
jgi:hypothetical protein